MCLAVPFQIISIEDSLANVEMSGVQRHISLALTPEAKVGDYVLVHTGYAIAILDEDEALETLRLFDEIDKAEQERTEGHSDQSQP
ncbi:MAG: HypC/HybG/HupF family hydrogenase formation chaperone [Anaerolineae bacterium]